MVENIEAWKLTGNPRVKLSDTTKPADMQALLYVQEERIWWVRANSNRRPLPCQGSTLTN